MPSLTFLGAARTVTGSKFLLDTGSHQVLVDAGLFQGPHDLRRRNWADLPLRADAIDSVVLTHAHLDHVGYLPRLVNQGFRGRVFCSPATADLCRLILVDSAYLQEEDARQANRERYSRHETALPLYSVADAWRALSQLQPVGFERPVPVAPGIEAAFTHVGHLLGAAAATLRLEQGGRTIVFGGDLGRYDRPVLQDPEPVAEADVLLCESTYGDRQHEPDDNGEAFARVVRTAVERGGRLIIPSFAIGRVEEILYWLKRLEEDHRVPVLPVHLDSPMAVEALRYYARRADELDPEYHGQGRGLAAFMTRRFQTVSSTAESWDLVRSNRPAIIISSSGMATGGRVLNHLRRCLPDPRHTVLFVGYQAPGTRGHLLVNGAPQVKMHGKEVPVSARIERIDSMSAHADAGEILRWLGGFRRPPEMTYLVHGEPGPQSALQEAMTARLGWRSHAPAHGERVEI